MTIQLFANVLDNAMGVLSQCQTLLMNVDRIKLRSVRKMLGGWLPEFEAVRNAAIRAGELMNDLDPAERHSSLRPQRLDGAEQGILRNRKYQNILDGKLQSYQVKRQTYEGMIAIAKEFYSAFGHYYKGGISSEENVSPQPLPHFVWWVRPD